MKRVSVFLALGAVAATTYGAAPRFAQTPSTPWTLTHSHPDRPALEVGNDGVRFVGRGVSTAVTPWAVGGGPFAFSFGLEIEKGSRQAWRWPGVFVALTSAKPHEMKEGDIAFSMSVHLQGPMVSVREGGLFEIYEQRPGAWRWRDKGLAPRYTLSMSGGGGHNYSVNWPGKNLDGTTLYFRLEREPIGTLQFSIFHKAGGNRPWWTGSYTLPDGMKDRPVQWVVVKSMVHQGDPDQPVPERDQIRGRVFDMQGGAPGVPFAPFAEPPIVEPALSNASRLPHPYVWFSREELPDLRRKFNEPMFASYRKLILDRADRPMQEIGQLGTPSHAAVLHAYLWAYLLSEKPDYKTRLMAAVDALLLGSDHLPAMQHGHPGRRRQALSVDSFMCHNAEAIATVYDALFIELTPEQRSRMVRYLKRHLVYYLEQLDHNDWWFRNNPSNTIAVGSACNGIAALALMPAYPEAEGAVRHAVQTINERYRAMADDGSCVEGNLYWDYGFSYQLLFGHALQHVTGDDRGLLTAPNLLKTHHFVETQLGGDGRYFPFNDTQPWLTGLAVCADFGSRLDNPLLRWMADRTAREAANGTTPVFTRPQFYALAFRARDLNPAPETFPGVPTLSFLETLHWGVMRSDGLFKPGLVVGVKGRDGDLTHHAQEDLGGFVLQADGESFLIDPGYYQPGAEAHSIPLVGGKGPNKRGRALISDAWEQGKLRTMTVDASLAYGVQRLRRVFVVYGDQFAAVLDDIDCEGPVTAQYQCGFPTELNDDHTVAAIAEKMLVQPNPPGLKLGVEGPIDFDRSWIFKETGVQWYQLRGDYRADPERPLVTVFSAKPIAVKRDSSAIIVEDVRFERTGKGPWRVAGPALIVR